MRLCLLCVAVLLVGCDGKTNQQRLNETAFISAVSSFYEQSKRGLDQFNDFPSESSLRSLIGELDSKLSRFPEARHDKLLNQLYGECESFISSLKQLHGYFGSLEKISGDISENFTVRKTSIPTRHRDSADGFESSLKKVESFLRNNLVRIDELLSMAKKR